MPDRVLIVESSCVNCGENAFTYERPAPVPRQRMTPDKAREVLASDSRRWKVLAWQLLEAR